VRAGDALARCLPQPAAVVDQDHESEHCAQAVVDG